MRRYDHIDEFIMEAVSRCGSINKAAAELDISRRAAQRSYHRMNDKVDIEYPELPSADVPIDELIKRKVKDYDRAKKARDARSMIRIKVHIDGPIALGIFGDPHTDDDGTDLGLLFKHADIVRETKGMYGINVGDNQNLWVGRLVSKYADQRTRADEGWRLTEEFLRRTRDWLCLMKGNHDIWQGNGDPLDWILKDMGVHYDTYDIKLCLVFPNGREYRIWLRHDFAGHSMWNNLHGLMRAAKFGANMHLLLAGHKHSSAHHTEFDANGGFLWHAIRSAGYKFIDEYADMHGFPESNAFQCPVVVINPDATSPAQLSTVIYDTEYAADFLTCLRKKC